MLNIKLIFLTLTLGLTGCLSKIDQAAPTSIEIWKHDNPQKIDISQAMLECGYPDFDGSWTDIDGLDKIIYAQRCMLLSGFYKPTKDQITCTEANKQLLTACQPNAVVPTRSIERRLNSPFCKDNPDSDLCTSDGQPKPQTNQPIKVAVISSKDGPTSPIDNTKTNARRNAWLLQQINQQQNIHDFNQMQKNMHQTQRQSQNSLKQ